MSLLLKDAAALLDYQVDWGAEYLDGDVIARSRWSVSPEEPGAVRILFDAFDERTATVQVGGGEVGKLYRVSNHVVTACGREDSRSFILRVEDR